MRVSKQQAADNRARIVSETSRLIRELGIDGIGVDALTRAAGLTHGSLYSQFGSKERLVEAALDQALTLSGEKTTRELAEGGSMASIARRYLSPEHRDRPGSGCALAAIGPEAARQGPGVRKLFTRGVRGMAERLTPVVDPAGQPEGDAALAAVASLVGALILARAVDDAALSDRILAASAARLSAPPAPSCESSPGARRARPPGTSRRAPR